MGNLGLPSSPCAVQSAAELKNLVSDKAADVCQMIKTPDLKEIDYWLTEYE